MTEERAVVADLHVHTRHSDGELHVSDLPGAARAGDLDAVAVTDHDRPHPALAAPVVEMEGVTLVHGIELRVETSLQRVDLLGYGLDPTPALREECERLQRDRIERARRIVACVEDRLEVDLDLELDEGVGRPHVARAIAAHPDVPHDVEDAFAELIGDGCPCYVARDVPSFSKGRRLLGESCALVGLAHPLRYEDPEAALARTATLDAVELCYPYDRPVDPSRPEADVGIGAVAAAIEEHDLVATGGSDAHGRTLGAEGLDGGRWAAVRPRLPEAVSEGE